MMTKMATVNVSFKLRVPVEYDEAGRVRHPVNTAAKYIDEYFQTLQHHQNEFGHQTDGEYLDAVGAKVGKCGPAIQALLVRQHRRARLDPPVVK
jgi:hypothetical protein